MSTRLRSAMILVLVSGCSHGPRSDAGASDVPAVDTLVAVDTPVVVDAEGGLGDAGAADAADGDAGPAGPLQFTTLGPRYANGLSGKINAIAFHPTDPATMLIAGGIDGPPTSSGVYRTTNGGTTWTAAMTGMVGSNGLAAGTVNTLWINPTQPNECFAGTQFDGIFRSVDGGLTWVRVDTTPTVSQLVSAGGTLFAGSSVGVLAWNAVTRAWSVVQATSQPVSTMTALGATVLAGTSAGDVYGLAAGAWSHLGMAPAGVHQLAINPVHPAIVYASIANGSYDFNLYVSVDGGATWASVAYPLTPARDDLLGVQAIAFSANVPGRLYVAGDGKTDWTTGDGNTNPVYTTAALDHFNPNGIYTDTRVLYMFQNAAHTDDRCFDASDQGISVSDNCSMANATVTALGNGLSTSLLTDFAVSPDGQSLVAMIQDFSAAVSTDGGASWTTIAPSEDGHAAINFAQPSNCYAFRDGFFASTDGCHTFTRTATFESSSGSPPTSNAFAFDPTNPARFFVVSDPPADPPNPPTPPSIQMTTNAGVSFTPVTWPIASPNRVAIAPGNARHILVAAGSALSVSQNGGATWTASTGLPTAGTLSFAISPHDEHTVLAAVFHNNAVTSYLSADGGATFTLQGTIVPASAWQAGGGVNLGGVVYNHNATAPRAVITTLNGAYLTADDGAHWQRIDTTLTTRRFVAAHFANGYLYLGSYGQGILRSTTRVE